MDIEMVQVRADGELHSQLGDPRGEGVCGTGGVGADQHLDLPVLVGFTQVGGDLGEGVIQDDEVVGSGIRTGVASSEQSRDWFSSAAVTVVAEHQQRMEPERLLPRLGRVLLL